MGESTTKKFTMKEKIAALGPGFLIVGSFIGPGTVTSSTRAGANYGFTLFWCVVFSVIAVIVMQGMAARLGIITQDGLAENLNKQSDKFEQEMTVDDRKQYIHQVNQQAQERVLASLDAIFGDGEGQRIYDYYDQSMYAMVRIVEVLRDTLAEINGEKRDNDAAKHQARKQSYTRKRRR